MPKSNDELIIMLPLDTEIDVPCCDGTLTLREIINRKNEAMIFFGILCPLCEKEGLILKIPIKLITTKGSLN